MMLVARSSKVWPLAFSQGNSARSHAVRHDCCVLHSMHYLWSTRMGCATSEEPYETSH
jgi:hypothetical protein